MKQVALVTGGSRGIGAATVKLLAVQGYDVCINYIKNEAAAQALQIEVSALGVRAIIVQADVAKETDVVRLFKTVDQQLGTITALVNNAAILRPQLRVEEMTAERINQILTTNYWLFSVLP